MEKDKLEMMITEKLRNPLDGQQRLEKFIDTVPSDTYKVIVYTNYGRFSDVKEFSGRNVLIILDDSEHSFAQACFKDGKDHLTELFARQISVLLKLMYETLPHESVKMIYEVAGKVIEFKEKELQRKKSKSSDAKKKKLILHK